MSKAFNAYGVGAPLIPVLPLPLGFENAPTINQTNFEIGQVVFTPIQSPTSFYLYAGGGNWVQFAASAGDIISVLGTANQITASVVGGTATLSTPATFIAPGSIAATTSVTATLGDITATNGNLVLSATGNKLKIHASTAASDSIGTSAALSTGTITVSTTAVKTASKIFLTRAVAGGTLGNISVGTIVDSTSFTITCDGASDTSTVNYLIIN